MELIQQIYEDPSTGYINSVDALYKKCKAKDKTITKNDVKEFLNNYTPAQIYRQVKKPKHLPIVGTIGAMQADL